jgi:TonB-linked SusC/RagA family outer membrane protein
MKFRNRTKIIIAMFFSLLIQSSYSQSTIVRGQVKDSKGFPLTGAIVLERDANNRTISGVSADVNGNYQLRVTKPSATLICTFMGCKPQEIKVNGRTTINIVLLDNENELKGVEIVGNSNSVNNGFMNVDKRNLASSASTIKMKDLEGIPAASIEEILDGRVSGLMVSMNSGDPGAGAMIQLRGSGSLGLNTRPLIVVDGIPWTSNIPAESDMTSSEGISNLLNIPPTDIATIDILKDAAATAVYGSEGANGVIAITTKRGDNIRPSVTVTSKFSFTRAPEQLPLLNGTQYKTMILEAYQNRYLMEKTPDDLFLEPDNINYENYNNNSNWLQAVTRSGLQSDNNLSIRGGGNSTSYSVSLGYLSESGTTIGTGFNRASGRLAFDYKVSSKLKFTSDVSFTNSVKKENTSQLIADANIIAPVKPIYAQDRFGNDTYNYFLNPTGFQGSLNNPVATAYLANAQTKSDLLNSSVQMQLRPNENLNLLSVLSLQYENSESDKFLPQSATGKEYTRTNIASGVNTATSVPKYGLTLYQKNWLTYNIHLDKHLFTIGGGTIVKENQARSITLVTDNTASESILTPYSSYTFSSLGSTSSLSRSVSLTSQMIYIFKDRYSVQAIYRRDGSSAFGGENRYGNFPSLSGFWRFGGEKLLSRNIKWIDTESKIRFSWGLTGRAPAVSASNYATYSSTINYGDQAGVKPDNFELSTLRWEKTEQRNLGLDLSLFKNRFNATVEVYDNVTNDLLWQRPVSTNSGFETAYQNFGELQNRGVELELTAVIVKNKDWRIATTFNVYKNDSKVLSLPSGNEISKQNDINNGSIIQKIRVGDAMGAFYGLRYKGVFANDEDAFVKNSDGSFVTNLSGEKIPIRFSNQSGYIFQGGDAIYEDINQDGVINIQDVVKIGDSRPKLAGGFGITSAYKEFSFNMFFNFRYGNQIFNATRMKTTSMYNDNNQTTAVMSRWRKQGDVTYMPRAMYGAGFNWVGSDRYVEDGSFLRMSNVSFTYRMANKMVNMIGLRALSFTLSGSNLLLWTKYSGVDPEVGTGSNTDPFAVGQDNSVTPRAKYFTFSTVVSF